VADRKNQPDILAPLLDRLTDEDPRVRQEGTVPYAQAVRRLRTSLRRDLEWLLNTRRTIVEVPEWCTELPYSLFQYGLPDLTGFSVSNPQDQDRLAGMIEQAIANFEPRLMNVSVSLLTSKSGARVVKFQIEGLLRIEPGPERIQFDTTLDLASGSYHVEGDGHA
jgi:type VI secretion system protein ImpF